MWISRLTAVAQIRLSERIAERYEAVSPASNAAFCGQHSRLRLEFRQSGQIYSHILPKDFLRCFEVSAFHCSLKLFEIGERQISIFGTVPD